MVRRANSLGRKTASDETELDFGNAMLAVARIQEIFDQETKKSAGRAKESWKLTSNDHLEVAKAAKRWNLQQANNYLESLGFRLTLDFEAAPNVTANIHPKPAITAKRKKKSVQKPAKPAKSR